MNGTYSIFKRDADGKRGMMVPNFSKLVISLQWLKASKFTITGKSAGTVPLEDGNQIIVYRNGHHFMSGIVEKIEISCMNPDSDIREWTATGRDLSLMFGWRMVLADPRDITFEGETYDRIEDTAWNRLLHYIKNCFGEDTIWERQIFPLWLPNKMDIGETALSAYQNKKLDSVLEEIGDNDDLVPYLDQDDKTGEWQVSIAESRDMTKEVYFSPNFGNVQNWKRWSSVPECNAVWVYSGDYSKGRLYVYAEDAESIEQYGRIEKIISRADLTVWEPSEDEEEEEEEEKPKLTEADVMDLLEQEAQSYLKNHGRKQTWTVSAVETQRMAFLDQWQLGDQVTCILDGERFKAQIKKVKITYEKGVEKVEPTIGDIEDGLFGEIFKMLRELDKRITDAEK